VDWLSVLKTKPRGRVELVQDENEDTSVRDEVFQVSELVEPYRVAPSIDLEENSNFHVFDDSLVDVDAEELMRSNHKMIHWRFQLVQLRGLGLKSSKKLSMDFFKIHGLQWTSRGFVIIKNKP